MLFVNCIIKQKADLHASLKQGSILSYLYKNTIYKKYIVLGRYMITSYQGKYTDRRGFLHIF